MLSGASFVCRTAEARTDEKWKNVDKLFGDLDKKIEKASGVLTKIMWIFVSVIILTFAAFFVSGEMKSQ